MSFWGGDTTVYVSSVIYPMGEDPDKIPDVVKASVIAAGLQGQSRARAIDKAIFDGPGVKLAQGYQYAKHHYYAGLPTGFPRIDAGKDDAQLNLLAKEYLEALYPAPTHTVVLKSVSVRYDNNYDSIVRQQIETEYSYDFFQEAVHTANHGLLVGATLVYEDLPADPVAHANQEGYRLTFTNPGGATVVIDKWYASTLFAGQSTVAHRVIMEASIDAGPALTFFYAFGGSDARLNIFLRAVDTPTSGTFPAIVLKKKNKYLDTDDFAGTPWATSSQYLTSKAYGKRFDIDIDDVLALIKDNPKENKIDYAFIQPGTKLDSPNTAVHEYHFKYFHRLFLSFPDNKPAYDAWVAEHGEQLTKKSKAENCPAQSIRLLDPDESQATLDVSIAWRYMTYEVKTGTLPQAYTVECGPQQFMNSRFATGSSEKLVKFDVTKLYLRRRLTSSTYAELVVVGLRHENYVYKKKAVKSGVWAAFNDKDGDEGSGFLIPLEYEVLMSLSARERLQLAQEAFHVVFNCYKIVKEKWYQTGIFKVVLIVLAVVVIILSGGSLAGPMLSLYSSVSAAVGAVMIGASLAAIAAVAAIITGMILVVVSVGVSFIAKEAGKWAAEQWGPEWGAVVSIVATLAMSWALAGGGFGDIGGTISAASLPTTVLNVTNAILGGLAVYTKAEYDQLREAQSKWNDYITSPENPLKEIERLMAEWFPENGMADLARDALFAPRESLDQFLTRTLTLTDSLIYKLTVPISGMSELTLTPRLI